MQLCCMLIHKCVGMIDNTTKFHEIETLLFRATLLHLSYPYIFEGCMQLKVHRVSYYTSLMSVAALLLLPDLTDGGEVHDQLGAVPHTGDCGRHGE